jgi:hypothetical protein
MYLPASLRHIPQVRDFKLQSFYYQGDPESSPRDKKAQLEKEQEDENAEA